MSKAKLIANMKNLLDFSVRVYVREDSEDCVKRIIARNYKIEAVAYNNLLIHQYSRIKDVELFPHEIEAYINIREYEKQQ